MHQDLVTWLARSRLAYLDDDPIPVWLEAEFRRYLDVRHSDAWDRLRAVLGVQAGFPGGVLVQGQEYVPFVQRASQPRWMSLAAPNPALSTFSVFVLAEHSTTPPSSRQGRWISNPRPVKAP